jgi:hypothetical protein
MDQLVVARDDLRLEQIAETLVAILKELRIANQREQQRDERAATEEAAAKEKFAHL